MLMEKAGRKEGKSKGGKGITFKKEKEDALNVSNSENGELAREAVQMLSRELEAFPLSFQCRCTVSVYFKLSIQTRSLHCTFSSEVVFIFFLVVGTGLCLALV